MHNQIYSIWIKAFASNTKFTDSAIVKIQTYPEPENLTLTKITPYSLEIDWHIPSNISRYILQYTRLNVKNDTSIVVYDSMNSNDSLISKNFIVNNLQPKVLYKFSVMIYYLKRETPYLWPIDSGFVFETSGDKPSPPGRPYINHVSGDVYQVFWEPSKENGSPIEEYNLEAYFKTNTLNNNRITRSTNNLSTNITSSGLLMLEEPEHKQPWTIYYNGTDTYWIIKDLHPITSYIFRVRARNAYGWSAYSAESEPIIEEPFISEQKDYFIYLLSASTISVALIIISLAICCGRFLIHHHHHHHHFINNYIKNLFTVRCRASNKKEFNETTVRIPDVELATLRNMPRRNNFIQSTNILYNTGPLNESEIAALPQIKREQITMTDFLGSGAFGEVYEGCVTNVGPEGEIRVAIKVNYKRIHIINY